MREEIRKIKFFISTNWFKVFIVLFGIIFLCFVGLYTVKEIKRYNYSLLKDAIICNRHYVPTEWQKCVDKYTDYYIGIKPELKFPY